MSGIPDAVAVAAIETILKPLGTSLGHYMPTAKASAIEAMKGVLEAAQDHSIEPATAVPPGYSRLPKGVRCRCIKLWTDGTDHYCCKGSRAA